MASHGNFGTAGTEGERREMPPAETTPHSAPDELGQSADTASAEREAPVPTKGAGRAVDFPFLSFPEKLWRMVESDEFQSIWWSAGGKCVAINEELFKEEVLGRGAPLRVFSMQSMKTFLRQMNRYGFTKLHQEVQRSASLPEFLAEEAAASAHSQILYYYNPGFNRQHPHLLQTCKRRVGVKRKALEALEMGERLHSRSPGIQAAGDMQETPAAVAIPTKRWAEAPPGLSSSLPPSPAALLSPSPAPGQSRSVPHCPTCTCSSNTADASDAHSVAHPGESIQTQQPGGSMADS